jgi:exopolyphosphatase / guanosine-5'-triphosphate,3'-diphosphate pyrophosphatase
VLHLARSFGVDRERADRVAAYALSLYDQSRGLLHHDDGEGRQLLWAAAQLHTCGKSINISAYHKHSWYLIRHGELLGYSQTEHLMVAAIARYHRRSLPKKRHESWQLITGREQRRCVVAMALLLRLAAALDRRPAAVIDAIRVRPPVATTAGQGEPAAALAVELVPRQADPGQAPLDLSLERWSLRSCTEVVLEASGVELRVLEPPLAPG